MFGWATTTSISGPNLKFKVGSCTYTYRALTAPAAKILGVAPQACPKGKPGCATSAGLCPAGQYRETETDVQPGACLLCPPGTLSKAPSNITSCPTCPSGHYTDSVGSKACKKCPSNFRSNVVFQATCATCTERGPNIVDVGGGDCQHCPAYSSRATSSYYDNSESPCFTVLLNLYMSLHRRCVGSAVVYVMSWHVVRHVSV
jgi:hypothetical protein